MFKKGSATNHTGMGLLRTYQEITEKRFLSPAPRQKVNLIPHLIPQKIAINRAYDSTFVKSRLINKKPADLGSDWLV